MWPSAHRRPNVAVLLVDADGDNTRRASLAKHVEGISLTTVIAIAVQEFESWLLGDQAALNRVAGQVFPRPPAVEQMKPGDAKSRLAACLASGHDAHAARREIAHGLELVTLARECASFGQFVGDMTRTAGHA
jgi:hypothetical protein